MGEEHEIFLASSEAGSTNSHGDDIFPPASTESSAESMVVMRKIEKKREKTERVRERSTGSYCRRKIEGSAKEPCSQSKQRDFLRPFAFNGTLIDLSISYPKLTGRNAATLPPPAPPATPPQVVRPIQLKGLKTSKDDDHVKRRDETGRDDLLRPI